MVLWGGKRVRFSSSCHHKSEGGSFSQSSRLNSWLSEACKGKPHENLCNDGKAHFPSCKSLSGARRGLGWLDSIWRKKNPTPRFRGRENVGQLELFPLPPKKWPCKQRGTCWIPPNKWMIGWLNDLMTECDPDFLWAGSFSVRTVRSQTDPEMLSAQRGQSTESASEYSLCRWRSQSMCLAFVFADTFSNSLWRPKLWGVGGTGRNLYWSEYSIWAGLSGKNT